MTVLRVLETAAKEWLGVLPLNRDYLDRVPSVDSVDALNANEVRAKVGYLALVAQDRRLACGFNGLIDWRLDGQISSAVRAGIFVPRPDEWLDLGPCAALTGAHLVLLGVGSIGPHFDRALWQALGRSVARSVDAIPEIETWVVALPESQHDAEDVAAFARGLVAGRRDGKIAQWDTRAGDAAGAIEEVAEFLDESAILEADDPITPQDQILLGLEVVDFHRSVTEPAVLSGPNEASGRDVAAASAGHEAGQAGAQTFGELDERNAQPLVLQPLDPAAELAADLPGEGDTGAELDDGDGCPDLAASAARLEDRNDGTPVVQNGATASADSRAAESIKVEPSGAYGAGLYTGRGTSNGTMRNVTWWIVTTVNDLSLVQSRIGASLGQLPLA
jgi:hypothetical protein